MQAGSQRHLTTASAPACPPLLCAVPKDMQLARRIRGPVYGVCSY